MGKVFTQPLLPWALRSGQCGLMNSAASVVANAGEKQVAIKTMPAIECPTPKQNLSGYISHTIVGRHMWATLQSGQIATAMSRLPKRKRKKWLRHLYHFRVPKAWGELKWIHHLWRIGAHVWAEFPQNRCHLGGLKGGENQSGYIKSALFVAHVPARLMHGTYHLGVPKAATKSKCLHNPYQLVGPCVGKVAR